MSMPWRPRRVHTGVRLPKDLRPVNCSRPALSRPSSIDIRIEVSLPLSAWPAAKTSPAAASRGSTRPTCRRAPAVGRRADPVVVHVDAERGGRRVAGQPARFTRDVRQREAEAAEFLRHGHLQIAGRFQFVEVFLAELVVAIVARAHAAGSSRARSEERAYLLLPLSYSLRCVPPARIQMTGSG